MLLRDWMVENNYTQAQLAEELGYARTHLSLVMGKKRPASPIFAGRVEKLTKGHITKDMIVNGRSLGTGGGARRVRRKGIPHKILSKNAISFL